MPLNLLLAVLTFVPALGALLVIGLGLGRVTRLAGLAVAGIATVLSAICLLVLAPYAGTPTPLLVSLAGTSGWLSLTYRVDAAAEYAGLGLTILVVPFLLWLIWQQWALAGAITDEASDEASMEEAAPEGGALPMPASHVAWSALAGVLVMESAILLALLSDNIIWAGIGWAVAAACAWWAGEAGTPAEDIDRAGLIFMLAGPVLWLAVVAFIASPGGSPLLYNLAGGTRFTPIDVVVLAVVLALASGAYPFSTWMRRRAVMASPAGLGALLLAVLPLAMLMIARTYGAATNAQAAWPVLGNGTPPLTVGVAFVVLGTLTVGTAGLVALGRRDVRALIILLAIAQAGWSMLGAGTGDPNALPGNLLLLATEVFGVAAMVAAATLGGTLGDAVEQEGAGPRPFGNEPRMVPLLAWSIGALSLVGAPLFGGFAPRQIITAAAFHTGTLVAPLAGLAWAGDALLLLALMRATAPAFAGVFGRSEDELEIEDEIVPDVEDEDELASEAEEPELAEEERPASGRDAREIPAVVFGLLALLSGVLPQALLGGGVIAAATAVTGIQQINAAYNLRALGYGMSTGVWLPTLAWLAIIVLGALLLIVLPARERVQRPVSFATPALPGGEMPAELAGMAEPGDAWRDLAATRESVFVQPGARQFIEPVEPTDEDDALDDGESAEDEDEPAVPVDTAPGSSRQDGDGARGHKKGGSK